MQHSHEHALALLRKAEDDAYVLRRGSEDPKMPAWILGFHAQQAVEKALKAVLTERGMEYPRTHDLSLLLKLVRDQGVSPPPDASVLHRLTPFGVLLRYDEEPHPSAEEALHRQWALDCVSRTLEWAATTLGHRVEAPS